MKKTISLLMTALLCSAMLMTAFAENAAETQITATPEQTIGTESAETPSQNAALATPHPEEPSSQVSALAGVVTAGDPVAEPMTDETATETVGENPTSEEIQNMFAQLDLEIQNAKGKTPIKYIDFDNPLMWLNPGETGRINFTIYPESARNEEITWIPVWGQGLAEMIEPGVFRAVSEGIASFKLLNNGELVGYVSINVKEGPPDVTGVTAVPKSITVRAGETFKSDCDLECAPGTWAQYTYTIVDQNIVGKSTDGINYYANGVGETDIKYFTYNGLNDICHVTVIPSLDPNFGTKPNLIKFTDGITGNTFTSLEGKGIVEATTYPTSAPADPITWTHSDPSVLKLTEVENGKAAWEAIGVGETVITVHCGDLSASVKLEVIDFDNPKPPKPKPEPETPPTPPTPETPPTPPASDGVADFVERLYTKVLGRGSDASGKLNWIHQLKSKINTGAEAARGFFMSEEFEARNVSNNEYLSILYRTFFDRDPDQGGLDAWTNQLNIGTSREAVLCGFANSAEFQAVCDAFNIERGTITATNPIAPSAQLNAFVSRLYTKLLDRNYDAKGLKAWGNVILNKQQTPQQVAHGFVFSQEFMNHNHPDDVFVEYMYKAFMGRDSDASGKANWVKHLKAGATREWVFQGFANSVEFNAIVKSFNL